MDGFIDNIEDATVENPNSRHVLYSGKHLQLVLISLGPSQETGVAVHDEGDQFLRIEVGQGVVTIDARESEIADGDGIDIPAGARHILKNTGEKPLKLFSLYAPPRYRESHVAATLDDAEALPEKFDGEITE